MGRPPRPYDLLWPVTRPKSSTDAGKVVEESAKLLTLKRFGNSKCSKLLRLVLFFSEPLLAQAEGTIDDLRSYAKMLVDSFPEQSTSGVRLKVPVESVEHAFEHERWLKEDRRQEMGGLSGCREAVDILTRNPKKGTAHSP